mgnify:CR=1 FL=1
MFDLNEEIKVKGSIDLMEKYTRLTSRDREMLNAAIVTIHMIFQKKPSQFSMEIRFNPRML